MIGPPSQARRVAAMTSSAIVGQRREVDLVVVGKRLDLVLGDGLSPLSMRYSTVLCRRDISCARRLRLSSSTCVLALRHVMKHVDHAQDRGEPEQDQRNRELERHLTRVPLSPSRASARVRAPSRWNACPQQFGVDHQRHERLPGRHELRRRHRRSSRGSPPASGCASPPAPRRTARRSSAGECPCAARHRRARA